MIHIDLFSGIGGFSLAADSVFGKIEHIFCDNNKFCQAVLKKHWPESEVYDDITSITDADCKRWRAGIRSWAGKGQGAGYKRQSQIFLLTGGFPCQPFSSAGLRRGTADDRYLWPEMYRVIRLTQPTWIIAENVRGLVTWNGGVVLEQVCSDLEAEGYQVQPLIIPAAAVNAPHRRDRVWFIAYAEGHQRNREVELQQEPNSQTAEYSDASSPFTNPRRKRKEERNSPRIQFEREGSMRTYGKRPDECAKTITDSEGKQTGLLRQPRQNSAWEQDWAEVAAKFCRVDDGLPVELDGLKLTKSQHRKEQLKAYGNAIVPYVAIEIMKAIKET